MRVHEGSVNCFCERRVLRPRPFEAFPSSDFLCRPPLRVLLSLILICDYPEAFVVSTKIWSTYDYLRYIKAKARGRAIHVGKIRLLATTHFPPAELVRSRWSWSWTVSNSLLKMSHWWNRGDNAFLLRARKPLVDGWRPLSRYKRKVFWDPFLLVLHAALGNQALV